MAGPERNERNTGNSFEGTRAFQSDSPSLNRKALTKLLTRQLKDALDLRRIDIGVDQEECRHIESIVGALVANRACVKAKAIPGEECLPFYEEDYDGTFNCSASQHLPRMISGFEPPSSEQIRELEEWRFSDKRRADFVYGTMDPKDVALVQSVVTALKPRAIFEFGTHQGILTDRIMQVAPEEAVMFTLDLPPDEFDSAALRVDKTNRSYVKHSKEEMGIYVSEEYEDRVIRLIGDSMRFQPGPLEGKMDLVIVDGGHQYLVAERDISNAWAMLAPGGVMLIDDYNTKRTEGVLLAVLLHRMETGEPGYLVSFYGDLETDIVMFIKPGE
ncbi:MAG: class I SAM-dependent methyltransferase [Bdellovibrionales bacterium]|nr:class I SAM-dependent methyltransferase [Bdellovibrionales bacterium]